MVAVALGVDCTEEYAEIKFPLSLLADYTLRAELWPKKCDAKTKSIFWHEQTSNWDVNLILFA